MSIVLEYKEKKDTKYELGDDPVSDMMRAKGIKKGKPKNYVVVYKNGDIIDHRGKIYEVREDDGEVIAPEVFLGHEVVLVHRKMLYKMFGPHISIKFWHNNRSINPKVRVVS